MKYSKQLILLALCLLTVVPFCNAKRQKKHKETKPEPIVMTKLPDGISYSKGFQFYWHDFLEETKDMTSLESYRPSNDLFNNHNIFIDESDIYCIRGFIQVNLQEFEAAKFEGIGGTLTYFSDGIYTFTMPVKSTYEMLKVKGILQIEMAQRAVIPPVKRK